MFQLCTKKKKPLTFNSYQLTAKFEIQHTIIFSRFMNPKQLKSPS